MSAEKAVKSADSELYEYFYVCFPKLEAAFAESNRLLMALGSAANQNNATQINRFEKSFAAHRRVALDQCSEVEETIDDLEKQFEDERVGRLLEMEKDFRKLHDEAASLREQLRQKESQAAAAYQKIEPDRQREEARSKKFNDTLHTIREKLRQNVNKVKDQITIGDL